MVKEFINEHSEMLTKDFQILLQKQVDEYKKMIDEINSTEELDEKEKEIIKEMEEFDEFVNETKYTLPDSVEFEGKKIQRRDIQSKFIYYLSNQEQSWEYVPTLYTLCKIWKDEGTTEVTHGVLDSTIRILGQLKFRGMSEWRDLMIIDRYLDPIIATYGKNTSYQIAMGHKHNAIINRRQIISPVQRVPQEEIPM